MPSNACGTISHQPITSPEITATMWTPPAALTDAMNARVLSTGNPTVPAKYRLSRATLSIRAATLSASASAVSLISMGDRPDSQYKNRCSYIETAGTSPQSVSSSLHSAAGLSCSLRTDPLGMEQVEHWECSSAGDPKKAVRDQRGLLSEGISRK